MAKKAKQMATVNVPQSKDEVEISINRLGYLYRDLELNKLAEKEAIAGVKKIHQEDAAPVEAEIQELSAGIKVWCEANRSTLTQNGKVKFHKFASGVIQWRSLPLKVSLSGVEKVIEQIKDRGLKHLLHVKESVNKEALLSNPEEALKIEGVKFKSDGETFTIEPNETAKDKAA